MTSLKRWLKGDLLGFHYAMLIFIAVGFLWLTHRLGAGPSPIWSIAAAVAVIDPQVRMACFPFRARILNVLIGCGAGLIFLTFDRSNAWALPFAVSAAGLLSSYFVRAQLSWRIAPIAAAIVIAAGLTDQSALDLSGDVRRVLEVVLGSLVGLVVPWLVSKLWLPPETSPAEELPVCSAGG
jgi:uncharacterized membrane protein YccC